MAERTVQRGTPASRVQCMPPEPCAVGVKYVIILVRTRACLHSYQDDHILVPPPAAAPQPRSRTRSVAAPCLSTRSRATTGADSCRVWCSRASTRCSMSWYELRACLHSYQDHHTCYAKTRHCALTNPAPPAGDDIGWWPFARSRLRALQQPDAVGVPPRALHTGPWAPPITPYQCQRQCHSGCGMTSPP